MIIASSTILIRKPVSEVFSAFIEPAMLTQFWLSKAEKPLKVGEDIKWEFMVPGAVVTTRATEIETDKKICWDWDSELKVRIVFKEVSEGTVVQVKNWGFQGDPQTIMESAIDSTQGFTIVLCDLKTFLENGRSARLVSDKALLIQKGAKFCD